jgi:signal transduction histidine kinase
MALGDEATLEFRVVPEAGLMRWVMARGSRHENPEGQAPVLMGIIVDITERRAAEDSLRRVSSRLIEAQEQERKRIARELHDNVSQQLAMISMGLQQLLLEDTLAPDGQNHRTAELIEEADKVARDVSALSHALHSSRLDFLGVALAIEGFCSELRKRHHVQIDFESSGVPADLPSDIALALFRITQEALHNAVKYSGVSRFQVRLKKAGMYLELTVNDAGVGFDLQKAAESEGLGLISMRERVAPFNGALEIRSQPG